MMNSKDDLTLNALFDQLSGLLDSIGDGQAADFSEYRKDPVSWCHDLLGETFPPEVEKLMMAVVEYETVIAQSCNAYGKSFAASRVALWWLICFPNSQVFITAAPPETNIRRILWALISSVVNDHPGLFKGFRIIDLHIERSATSYLTALTIPMSGSEAVQEAKASGKHAEHLLWIGDEADGIPEPVFKGIEGCSSGGLSRQLYMFNPREKAGRVYRMIRDRRAYVVQLNAFTHPNVVTGRDIYPGAVSRAKVVRRINEWSRPLRPGETPDPDSGGYFELPDFLVGEVGKSQRGETYPPLTAGNYKITDGAFSYMVLGRYPSEGSNQLISLEWINEARSRYDSYVAAHGVKPPQYTKGVMGFDPAEFGPDPNCCAFRYGGFVEPFIVWNGVDPVVSGERATTEYRRRPIKICNVDGTGIGAGVAPHMQRTGCSATTVKVSASPTKKSDLGEFGTLRDQLWWSIRDWLKNDQCAMLPPDEELLEELAIATYRYDFRTGKIKIMDKDTMKEHLRRSPNKADALGMTFYQGGFFEGCDFG